MPPNKISAAELIEKAGDLFRINGYHNTSIADIADYCGLSKASVYHHVKSKKTLALIAIKRRHDDASANVFDIAYQKETPECERLEKFIAAQEEFFTRKKGGCLVGNMALEINNSALEDEFNLLFRDYFSDWVNALQYLFQGTFGTEKAKEIAEDAVSLTQGALMMMQVYKSDIPLKRVGQRLLGLLKTKEQGANVLLD